jgi:hypothetical protein
VRKTIAMASVFAILVMAVGLSVQAGDGKANPKVLAPNSKPYGKTYGEWGAAWQQWVIKTTTENCPVTDNTGERALVGQSAPVYFLAGTFGEMLGTPWEAPNPVTRDVTIPAGVALCIPINDWGVIYPEDFPEGTSPEDAIAMGYEWLNGAFDEMPESDLLCVVDGVAITNLRQYRSQSEPFMIYAPADNVYNDIVSSWGYPPYAEGWHLSISDGYYVILAPLSAGQHTIHLRSGPADSPFCDVYYNLTVKAK